MTTKKVTWPDFSSSQPLEDLRVKTDVGIQALISHISEAELDERASLDEGSYIFSREKTRPYEHLVRGAELQAPQQADPGQAPQQTPQQAPQQASGRQTLEGVDPRGVAAPDAAADALDDAALDSAQGPLSSPLPEGVAPAGKITRQTTLRRLDAEPRQDIDPMLLTQRWLEQLQAQPLTPTWVHLPAHNQLCFDLLIHQGRLVFGPSRGGRLFLDFQFRRQAPELTRRLRDLFMSRGHERPWASLCAYDELEPLGDDDRAAMAAQLMRVIYQSATLYGPKRARLEFTPCHEGVRPNLISFGVEELLPPRATSPDDDLVEALYPQLKALAEEAWLMIAHETLSWEHLVDGPSTFDLARLHAMMRAAGDVRDRASRMTQGGGLRTWLGLTSMGVWSITWTSKHVIMLRAQSARLGRLVTLLDQLHP